MNIRTDLASEAFAMNKGSVSGIENECEEKDGIRIERVRIKSEEAAEKIGKGIGNYVTITVRDLSENDRDEYEAVCLAVADELREILRLDERTPVMAVGLGNRSITADSVGPRCVDHLLVTRHIKEMMPEEVDESVRALSALSPGVMATTGIETSEIIRGVIEKVKPGAVIVIDALAARSMGRLGRTIQIADTGISPGSGVGNNRRELSKNTLGVPVVAVGVPMVVDASTVAADCMEIAAERSGEADALLKSYEREEPEFRSMVVTPKDVDSLAERSARVIANGINLAIQSAMTRDDIDRYTPV